LQIGVDLIRKFTRCLDPLTIERKRIKGPHTETEKQDIFDLLTEASLPYRLVLTLSVQFASLQPEAI
jgi:hypothetical protein